MKPDPLFRKGLPANLDAERCILGSIVLNDTTYSRANIHSETQRFAAPLQYREWVRGSASGRHLPQTVKGRTVTVSPWSKTAPGGMKQDPRELAFRADGRFSGWGGLRAIRYNTQKSVAGRHTLMALMQAASWGRRLFPGCSSHLQATLHRVRILS